MLTEGSGAPERDHRRFVGRETRVRAALAHGLLFLGAHPRLQEGVARALRLWPRATTRLAGLVAGA